MKPVLKKEKSIYYVSDADIIQFISENYKMDWNKCCEFVSDNNITGKEGRVFWTKESILKNPKAYNEEQVRWIGAFFEAHPWIESMMIVFDD